MADRAACRIMFLAFCLLPTMLVAGWTVLVHSPPYQTTRRTEWEQLLTRQTGLRIQVQKVHRLRDGRIELGNVEILRDGDSPIATLHQVTLRQEPRRWQLDATSVELQSGQMGLLWDALDHRLLRDVSNRGAWVARLAFDELRVRRSGTAVDGNPDDLLVNVDWTLRATATVRASELQFSRQDSMEISAPIQLNLMRNPSDEVTRLKLLASPGLPVRLLSTDLQLLAGNDCDFHGEVHAMRKGDRWTAAIHGALRQIELSRIAPLEVSLDGMATLQVDAAQLVDGRLVTAAGRLSGGPGRISNAALKRLAQYVEVEAPASTGDAMAAYQQLSVQFWLNDLGLALLGDCAAGEDTVLLAREGQPLLRSRKWYASHFRVLQGLARSRLDADVLRRRAPYPATTAVAAQPPTGR